MGAILIALTLAVLFVDGHFEPLFPFWFALVGSLSAIATFELLRLFKPGVRPFPMVCATGILALLLANWLPHQHDSLNKTVSAWPFIAGAFAGSVLLVFLVEMATFREPGTAVTRMALGVWLLAYLGLLPSFLAQMRWLSRQEEICRAAMVLTIFVPKCCDIGAYFTGRLIGMHKMSPILSPKKTWEGAAGGLGAAVLAAVLLDRLGPASILCENVAIEIGFGFTVGLAGMFGDLAESLIKRDCQTKDASHAVPGFGGVLDVVDAILFAAPVGYLWFAMLR
jgi:phosphatidate cytidylyltransferase